VLKFWPSVARNRLWYRSEALNMEARSSTDRRRLRSPRNSAQSRSPQYEHGLGQRLDVRICIVPDEIQAEQCHRQGKHSLPFYFAEVLAERCYATDVQEDFAEVASRVSNAPICRLTLPAVLSPVLDHDQTSTCAQETYKFVGAPSRSISGHAENAGNGITDGILKTQVFSGICWIRLYTVPPHQFREAPKPS
jgi:hypothetical protein